MSNRILYDVFIEIENDKYKKYKDEFDKYKKDKIKEVQDRLRNGK